MGSCISEECHILVLSVSTFPRSMRKSHWHVNNSSWQEKRGGQRILIVAWLCFSTSALIPTAVATSSLFSAVFAPFIAQKRRGSWKINTINFFSLSSQDVVEEGRGRFSSSIPASFLVVTEALRWACIIQRDKARTYWVLSPAKTKEGRKGGGARQECFCCLKAFGAACN